MEHAAGYFIALVTAVFPLGARHCRFGVHPLDCKFDLIVFSDHSHVSIQLVK